MFDFKFKSKMILRFKFEVKHKKIRKFGSCGTKRLILDCNEHVSKSHTGKTGALEIVIQGIFNRSKYTWLMRHFP